MRWNYVTTVESESEPGATYDIKERGGVFGCGCRSYRFSKGVKTCKHLRAYLGVSATAGRSVTVPLGTSASIDAQGVTTVRQGGETFRVYRRAIRLGGAA